jgi:peptidase M50B-like protein
MKQYSLAHDARPQVSLLLTASAVSLALWIISWFIPLVAYIVYPLQLFATFIHEGGHVLAALLTGGSVASLTVSPDTSGEVFSTTGGWFSQLFVSSAGYLGTTAFGAGLLAWLRFGFSARLGLLISAGIVAVLTVFFGFFAPILSLFQSVTFGSFLFTLFSGALLSIGLAAIAKYADMKWTNFAFAFLAVQCLLNAVFSLLELVLITSLTNAHSDAANMAAATGIPAIMWAILWIGISIAMISIGLRIYAVNKKSATDSVFND